MEKLEYSISISAPAEKVWKIMLEKDTYQQWVNASWPDSTYEGRWEQGTRIKFFGPEQSGTLALLEQVKPHRHVLARHIAILAPGGVEDTTSEMAKNWIGITEAYTFEERDGKTKVIVTIETYPEWKAMFDEGWPGALQALKTLSERNS